MNNHTSQKQKRNHHDHHRLLRQPVHRRRPFRRRQIDPGQCAAGAGAGHQAVDLDHHAPPRPGEQDGREYHFTTADDFVARADRGEFLEWAEVHGNYYGTSRLTVEQEMKTGTDILLEIDWQGARQVKKQFPDAAGIFILPPSIAALEERLHKRGTDEPHIITRRLLAAGGEIAHAPEFEYAIINEEFNVALSELQAIVKATRCRFAQQAARNASLFAQLGIHAQQQRNLTASSRATTLSI
jgi:guanylate kinase